MTREMDDEGPHSDVDLGEDPRDHFGYADAPAGMHDNFKVVIRVRPPLPRELNNWKPFQNTVYIDESEQALTLSENLPAYAQNPNGIYDGLLYATYRFTFDHVFGPASTQAEVYARSAQPVVQSMLEGYNAAIVAYGQTGTGKTFTMEGNFRNESAGIVPRAIADIFQCIRADAGPTSQYLVRASYLQIYNEVISDLLDTNRTNLTIREDRRRGTFVEGLSYSVVRNQSEIMELMARGASHRATGATKLNDVSSRSHAVFIIIVEHSTSQAPPAPAGAPPPASAPHSIKVGKLNLVDLAGSERVHITGATGKRLEESKKINQSLSALGNVIAALTDNRSRQHIPYRDSRLTRYLADSIGGNCKTTMMCMVSPALEAFPESVSTLKFANRAKNIRNRAEVNDTVDHRTLLRKYEKELKRLRSELLRRNKLLVDKRHLLQVDEQRRRAEADKLAAITELETRSREFMQEKQDKQALEEQIATMQSQMLTGIETTPHFRNVIAEYDERLRDLERERLAVEDDKAQVDRFKQLLLKQRDIMQALTKRLDDRDEQILTLQEEVDAYDKYQRKLEDALDQRLAQLIALRKAAMEHTALEPKRASGLQSVLGAWGGSAGGSGALPSPRIAAGRDADATHPALDSPASHRGSASDRSGDGSRGSRDGGPDAQAFEVQRLRAALADAEARAAGAGPRGGDREAAAAAAAAGARADQLEQQVAALQRERQQMQETASARDAAESEQVAQLSDQVENHARERMAIKTILESKMKLLAGQIEKGLGDLQGSGVEVPSRIMRHTSHLGQLVKATIAAMAAADEDPEAA